MIRIENIKLPLGHGDEDIIKKIHKVLGTDKIQGWKITGKSVDARDKHNILLVYSVDISISNEKKYAAYKNVKLVSHTAVSKPQRAVCIGNPPVKPPVVAGSGPAGIFAALTLAEAGLCPVILERGRMAQERKRDVESFWTGGALDTESNVLFGEGGAGLFSDGKLTTGIKDGRISKVINEFITAGAPEEIAYLSKPHIGTDNLMNIAVNMRNKITDLGGRFLFGNKLTDIIIENGELRSVAVEDENGSYTLETAYLVLAVGHSARDTFEKLSAKLLMEPKAFSVGVRIEHRQNMIDTAQYGSFAGHPRLGAAEYKINTRTADGRGVYTFCMCPGGAVVAAASEQGMVCTNGMSYYARNMENANSALLVSVMPQDCGDGVLSGIDFQRRLERLAFDLGGGGHKAPVQLVGDFLLGKTTTHPGNIQPSYKPGVTYANLNECLPDFVSAALKEALPELDRKINGFAAYDAVLTAVESRSSSPVRIVRGSGLNASIRGVYPCGEGAGYAGGIVSAAVDGIRCAEEICKLFLI